MLLRCSFAGLFRFASTSPEDGGLRLKLHAALFTAWLLFLIELIERQMRGTSGMSGSISFLVRTYVFWGCKISICLSSPSTAIPICVLHLEVIWSCNHWCFGSCAGANEQLYKCNLLVLSSWIKLRRCHPMWNPSSLHSFVQQKG